MSDVSREYHNLRYAVLTLCDCIESCSVKKVVEERYLPRLDELHEKLKTVKMELAKEMSDQKKQRERWGDKIRRLKADAACDETLDEDIREKIILSLEELSDSIACYGKKDS